MKLGFFVDTLNSLRKYVEVYLNIDDLLINASMYNGFW